MQPLSPQRRAYVYDVDGKFMSRASHEADPGKEYGPVYGEFEDEVKELIVEHANSTGSTVALGILNNWNSAIKKFVQVFPVDFKAALEKVGCPNLHTRIVIFAWLTSAFRNKTGAQTRIASSCMCKFRQGKSPDVGTHCRLSRQASKTAATSGVNNNNVNDNVNEALPLLNGVQHLSAAEKETIGVDPSPDARPKEVDLEELVPSDRPVKVCALKIQTIRRGYDNVNRLRNTYTLLYSQQRC
jgi:glutamate synthase domain-containing protein 3